MGILSWLNYYSVQNTTIDNQHKELINIINRVFDNVQKKGDRAEISIILRELVEYALVHFKTEEDIMHKYGYPQIEEHKNEHFIFKEKVSKMIEEFDQGANMFSLNLFTFLRNWFYEHIIKSDKLYFKYFKENNIKEYFV